jgi:hypothetical protein
MAPRIRPPHPGGCRHAVRAAFITCVAFALAVALAGCGRSSPQGTAQRYLDYLRQFNYAACYGMLAEQDKKDRDFSEFLTAIPLAPDTSPLWFRAVLHVTHYTLGAASGTGDRAVVAVQVTTPDLPLWERRLDAAAGPDHIGGEEAARSLDTGDYPKLTYSDQIVLAPDHHRWRVVADLAARDHLMDQYRAAVALYDQSDFDAAAAAYRKLLGAADQLNATGIGQLKAVGQAELTRTEKIIRERPAAADYIARSLKLSDVAMKMSEDRVPGIFGTIVNGGGRAIDQATLAVTWYEGRGPNLRQIFREQDAIVITPLQFTDFTRPVVPFQPGATRQFGFILAAPAEVQQEAAPYVTIRAIVFASAPMTPAPSRPPIVHPHRSSAPAGTLVTQAPVGPSPAPSPIVKAAPAKSAALPESQP